MAEEYRHAECIGNLNDKQPYVVGIPMPSATLYVEHPPDMMNLSPPSDFGALKKKNSFQITSVTVQGSRLNNNNDEFADDSADDLDESHAEDLTSEILDSSKATDFDAEQSDENSNAIYDDLSPCSGPIIIAKLPSNMNEPAINVGLSIGIPPAFSAVGPNAVSSGVTMMTSSATTPVSAQVPIINPLTDHWQHRFKVVKIVSSEPFKRGRWLCMDFMDPPAVQHDVKPEAFDRSENPAAPGTQCIINSQVSDVPNDNTVAHVYEIPVNQSYPGSISLAVGDQQQPQPLYGIILPVNNNQPPQVTMVHNIGTQTLLKDNVSQQPNQNVQQNVALNNQQAQMASDTPHNVHVPQNQSGLPPSSQAPTVSTASVQQIPLIPPTQASTVNIPGNRAPLHSANGNESTFAVPSQVPVSVKNGENVDIMPKPALSVKPPGEVLPEKSFPRTNTTGEDSESFSCLATELCRTSGLTPPPTSPAAATAFGNNKSVFNCLSDAAAKR